MTPLRTTIVHEIRSLQQVCSCDCCIAIHPTYKCYVCSRVVVAGWTAPFLSRGVPEIDTDPESLWEFYNMGRSSMNLCCFFYTLIPKLPYANLLEMPTISSPHTRTPCRKGKLLQTPTCPFDSLYCPPHFLTWRCVEYTH